MSTLSPPDARSPVSEAFPPQVMELHRAPRAPHGGVLVMADLESALRRAACWAVRGMPDTGAQLLAGTESRLRFRRDPGDLRANLPSGEEIRVALCTRRERVFITRLEGDYRVTASADLPPHLVEHAG